MDFWQLVLADVSGSSAILLFCGFVYFVGWKLPVMVSNFRLQRRMDRNLRKWNEDEKKALAEAQGRMNDKK
jgi:hypothetical protein